MVSNVQDTDTLTPERQTVLRMHLAGTPVREIASELDVSTQRIYQQLKKLRDDGHLKEAS